MGLGWRGANQTHHLKGDTASTDHFVLELSQLLTGRQVAIPEHIGDFFKAGILGQIVDVVPGVNQPPHIAEHLAHFALSDDYTF